MEKSEKRLVFIEEYHRFGSSCLSVLSFGTSRTYLIGQIDHFGIWIVSLFDGLEPFFFLRLLLVKVFHKHLSLGFLRFGLWL